MPSNLGINPINDGTSIRLVFPAPTEERRRELAKHAKKYCEDAKVAIRNIRRDVNTAIKKDDSLTEDEVRRSEEAVQKVTDEMTKKIDEIFKEKRKRNYEGLKGSEMSLFLLEKSDENHHKIYTDYLSFSKPFNV